MEIIMIGIRAIAKSEIRLRHPILSEEEVEKLLKKSYVKIGKDGNISVVISG